MTVLSLVLTIESVSWGAMLEAQEALGIFLRLRFCMHVGTSNSPKGWDLRKDRWLSQRVGLMTWPGIDGSSIYWMAMPQCLLVTCIYYETKLTPQVCLSSSVLYYAAARGL